MNPEFERNLWLEASPRRLIGAGVFLALIYAATGVLARSADPHLAILYFSKVGAGVFGACGVIWAAWAAGGSVLDEIRGRTWEFQRLSALTPWAMTWGKLFGAGALANLAGATGLIVLGVADAAEHGALQAAMVVTGLAALAVFVQSCAMGAALIGVRKARAEGRMATGGAVVLGVLGGLVLLSALSGTLPHAPSLGGGIGPLHIGQGASVIWWGGVYSSLAFVSLSLCAFAAWALVGAWRLMRLELQMRNTPWVWVGFLIFAAIWRMGLTTAGPDAQALTAAVMFVVAAYICAFVEPIDTIKLRRFAAALRSRRPVLAADLAPAAVFPVKLAILAVIAYSLLPTGSGLDFPQPGWGVAWAVLAFMVRDLGVITLFRFGPTARRGDLTAVIALALLYWVGALVGHLVLGHVGVALFSPISGDGGISLVAGVVEAVIAWLLAARRLSGAGATAR